MRLFRTFFFSAIILAAPLTNVFAQGAPPKSSAPVASQKATSSASAATPPATSATATAAPSASVEPVGPSHEIVTEVDNAMSDKAQALFKEGNAHFKATRYAQAQASYKAAVGLDPKSQKIVRNLGLTELELKMFRDAAEHLTIALRLSDSNDPKRPKIQSEVMEARAQVGTLNLKIKHGGQELDGVEIVDMKSGKTYETPLVDPIFVDSGTVQFRIRREGYESQEKVYNPLAGVEQNEEVTLERPPGYAGGATTGAPTSSGSTAAPRSKLPAFILGGAGVAAMIAGGALMGVAVSQDAAVGKDSPKNTDGTLKCNKNPAPNEDSACADLRSRATGANTLENVGIGVLVVGGALAVAAGVYLLVPSPKGASKKAQTHIIPAVGNRGGGLLLTGSF